MRLVIGKAEMARLGSLRPDRRRRGEEQHGGHENGIDAHSGASLSLSFIVTPQKRGQEMILASHFRGRGSYISA